jgi:hypothetical protein
MLNNQMVGQIAHAATVLAVGRHEIGEQMSAVPKL